jgi:hypothetical protein
MTAWGLAVAAAAMTAAGTPALEWTSPAHHRLILGVDPGAVRRSHSPAGVDVDFAAELAARHAAGAFDETTVEVIAYDDSGHPRVFDPRREGRERFLLPWRIDREYPLSRGHLRFVLPDERARRLAVYFDSKESGRGRPQRYPGLVGDGDRFAEAYGRRERAASAHDAWVDLDGDGRLDLVTGGTEPFLEVYLGAGGGRLVERGRLTSAGAPLVFPSDDGHRAWLSPAFADWDGDGDPDLFVTFAAGPYINRVVRYENVTVPGGPLTFQDRGPLATVSGVPLTDRIAFVDWDGDGRLDVLSFADGLIALHRNVGTSRRVEDMQIADGEYLAANGVPIQVETTSADAADLDGDGDLDLVVGTEEGRVFLFENVGTRAQPRLAVGRLLFFFDYMDAKAGVKVADFDGDGLLDVAVGRYWERTHQGDQPRVHGRLFKNVGTRTAPRFEARDAAGGAPFTEGFHPIDAVRQNGVRAVDWDDDGRVDLVVGDTDGFVWLFRNTTDALFPVFAPGERIRAAGQPLKVYGEEPEARLAGYARVDVADWNGDGRKDLVVADGRGWVWLFLNEGTDARPVLGRGRRLAAEGRPIDGTSRGSVLVRDWNGDGLPDLLFAMVGEGPTANPDWPPRNADARNDRGFLYYRNVGTRTQPVLAAPKWIKAGPAAVEIDVTRPNLGDFVDWDGDGRKDFLACEFENECRVWRRTDAGGPGAKPVFAGPAEGETVLAPWTDQMISGLDARDWDGDGDVDLLTGQGHGGSGVRFFERDALEDMRRGTSPLVTIDRDPDPVPPPR